MFLDVVCCEHADDQLSASAHSHGSSVMRMRSKARQHLACLPALETRLLCITVVLLLPQMCVGGHV